MIDAVIANSPGGAQAAQGAVGGGGGGPGGPGGPHTQVEIMVPGNKVSF